MKTPHDISVYLAREIEARVKLSQKATVFVDDFLVEARQEKTSDGTKWNKGQYRGH